VIEVSFFDPIANEYDLWYERPLGRFVDEVETKLALELSTSVFRHASFKTEKDLEELDPKNLVKIAQCVFIPPDASEEQLNWDEEKRLSKTQRGGFIIALWTKPS
jgi:hypothetical protein